MPAINRAQVANQRSICDTYTNAALDFIRQEIQPASGPVLEFTSGFDLDSVQIEVVYLILS